MGHGGSRGGSDIENLLAGSDVNVVQTSQDTGSQLGAERVPNAVLDLLGGQVWVGRRLLDGNALLAVDRLAWDKVAGHEKVLLALFDRNAVSTGLKPAFLFVSLLTLATKTPG